MKPDEEGKTRPSQTSLKQTWGNSPRLCVCETVCTIRATLGSNDPYGVRPLRPPSAVSKGLAPPQSTFRSTCSMVPESSGPS